MAIMVLCEECCAKRKFQPPKDAVAKKKRCTACSEFTDCKLIDTTKTISPPVLLKIPDDLPLERVEELVFPGTKKNPGFSSLESKKKPGYIEAQRESSDTSPIDASCLRAAREQVLGNTVQKIMGSCLLAAREGKSTYKSELELEEAIEISVCAELRKRGVEVSNTRSVDDIGNKITLTISW